MAWPAGGVVAREKLKPGTTGEPPAGLGAVVRELEKRVCELESTARPILPGREVSAAEVRPAVAETKEIQTLIARGKAKLAAGEAQEAIDCFDAVLRFDARNIEALVRQGRALEAVGRTAEAVENYERAFAADATLAAVFLGKGDVVHLLEQIEPAHGRG
jgi:tetratricopeptide (TPR) repeat protein